MQISEKQGDMANSLAKRWFRARVKSASFSLISNNCWGAGVYPACGLAYQTPFVGLFLMTDCYYRLLSNFREIIDSPLSFKAASDYSFVNEQRDQGGLARDYPIGALADEVEIQFLHYASEEEARKKWERRRSRLCSSVDNLFVRFGSSEVISDEQLSSFEDLPFRHKAIFVGRPAPAFESAVYMPSRASDGRIPDNMHQEHLMFRNRFFDLADWLNGGSGKPKGAYRLVMTHLLAPKEFRGRPWAGRVAPSRAD